MWGPQKDTGLARFQRVATAVRILISSHVHVRLTHTRLLLYSIFHHSITGFVQMAVPHENTKTPLSLNTKDMPLEDYQSSPESYAFLVHSQDTLNHNLPPSIDNAPLVRQKRRRTR